MSEEKTIIEGAGNVFVATGIRSRGSTNCRATRHLGSKRDRGRGFGRR